jgi:hypothetical protein
MSHTPGPWKILYVNTPQKHYPLLHIDSSNGINGIIATVYSDDEPNARLIAAAPDLLDACRKLANEASGFLALSDMDRHGMTNSRILRQRIDEARDAIAKAEGEQ